jgi:dCMP deaminase
MHSNILLCAISKANECAKFIIQSGINEIVYLKDDDEDSDSSRASRILFEVAGVKMTRMKPTLPFINISFGDFQTEHDNSGKKNTINNRHQNDDEMEKYLGLMLREANFNPFKSKVQKRKDYLSWDDYFMAVAFLSAMRSKDPNTQVGACIVDTDKCIIGIGYNGFPRGCSDEHLPWARSGECDLHKKYPYVVHAEVNAILNKCSANVRGATIYVALFPCNECSKVIIQSGIREVVYLKDIYHDTDACRASRIMFKMAGVKLRQYTPHCGDVLIDFRPEL